MRAPIIPMGAVLLAMLASAGCAFHARDADSYREATRGVLETRNADIKACYDAELEKDKTAHGKVVVRFTVKADTGQIAGAALDTTATTAPASLGACVVNALEGLALDPPDARDGDATFSWAFEIKK